MLEKCPSGSFRTLEGGYKSSRNDPPALSLETAHILTSVAILLEKQLLQGYIFLITRILGKEPSCFEGQDWIPLHAGKQLLVTLDFVDNICKEPSRLFINAGGIEDSNWTLPFWHCSFRDLTFTFSYCVSLLFIEETWPNKPLVTRDLNLHLIMRSHSVSFSVGTFSVSW